MRSGAISEVNGCAKRKTFILSVSFIVSQVHSASVCLLLPVPAKMSPRSSGNTCLKLFENDCIGLLQVIGCDLWKNYFPILI